MKLSKDEWLDQAWRDGGLESAFEDGLSEKDLDSDVGLFYEKVKEARLAWEQYNSNYVVRSLQDGLADYEDGAIDE